jgi:hypothetical protein
LQAALALHDGGAGVLPQLSQLRLERVDLGHFGRRLLGHALVHPYQKLRQKGGY